MKIQVIDFKENLQKVFLWQYNNAQNLLTLNGREQSWIDANHTKFWTDWYNNVFNLDTANDFGLAIWSILLGLPLFVEITPDEINKKIFGFDEYYENFDNGAFTSESQSAIILTLKERRAVLKLRYFYLTTSCAVHEINKNLNRIFIDDFGSLYMLDNLDMSVTYVFDFSPSDNLLTVLNSYNILPTPSGVDTILVTP